MDLKDIGIHPPTAGGVADMIDSAVEDSIDLEREARADREEALGFALKKNMIDEATAEILVDDPEAFEKWVNSEQ